MSKQKGQKQQRQLSLLIRKLEEAERDYLDGIISSVADPRTEGPTDDLLESLRISQGLLRHSRRLLQEAYSHNEARLAHLTAKFT